MTSTTQSATAASPPALTRAIDRRTAFWSVALIAILALLIRADVSLAHRVAGLSNEGTAAPAHEVSSATGYVHGQRHFLGTHERGETYRWIASTQELLSSGPSALASYTADNVPMGRSRLMPRIYAGWLASLSWALHTFTGESLGLSAEQVALWEPAITHAIAFLAAVWFMWARFGPLSAIAAGLFVAFYPPLAGQFLPGVLTPRTWSLLLAVYALAISLARDPRKPLVRAIDVRAAVASALALWLDPSIGFPAVLISAVVGAAAILMRSAQLAALRWSILGAAITFGACLVDHGGWQTTAGELRYVHPAYAIAWLGLGLALDGLQKFASGEARRTWPLGEIVVGVSLVSTLVYIQIAGGYRGWLYASAAMRRLTSLDETMAFQSMFDWLAKAYLGEVMIVSVPAGCALATIVAVILRRTKAAVPAPAGILSASIPLAGALATSLISVRWVVVASLISLPLLWQLALLAPLAWRRSLAVLAVAFPVALLAAEKSLPMSLQRSADARAPGSADIEALVFRQFSHWLASHNPGHPISALAPPALSDSLIFHGGVRVLMSTAWESYPGQVAASRVLSAPEASEAEAVLESRGITHVILPSWDRVLPLLVKAPLEQGKDSLYERLNTWVLPPYLRAIPYPLPPAPGYAKQSIPVFKVVPSQDEALALSRLAEDFVEMNRSEPAGLAAKALADAFADDPNALIARATVHAHARDKDHFELELDRLAADAAAGRTPFSWDRRVQRAILLALGRRGDLARSEIQACVAEATPEAVQDLTPLQAFRRRTLAKSYGFTFRETAIAEQIAAISTEYGNGASPTPGR